MNLWVLIGYIQGLLDCYYFMNKQEEAQGQLLRLVRLLYFQSKTDAQLRELYQFCQNHKTFAYLREAIHNCRWSCNYHLRPGDTHLTQSEESDQLNQIRLAAEELAKQLARSGLGSDVK